MWMPNLPRYVLVGCLVAALLLLERLRPASAKQRGAWLDNIIVFAVSFMTSSATGPLIAVAETGLINAAGGGLVDLRAMPLWMGAAIYLVAMDLGEYLFHRAQHAIPWLWAMHSLHHSDPGMNISTAQRHFWLDPAMKAVSIWLAVALLFRASGPILAIYAAVSLYHLFTHANVRVGFGPLSWLWNAPQYHRLHHSRDAAHFNANFAALLPIFDVISGAYRAPMAGEYPDTGLEGEVVSRPLDLVFWPVRKVFGRGILARFSARGGATPRDAAAPGANVVQAESPGRR
jgi:sterol desaturase/sphingolipid hydroxylase (fatty acid hydroxylase superfamily)